LNASDIAAGPIALLTLPVRVRSTFHGMWVSERALTTGRYVA
jgi:carotenoid cleavage dioxygenase-like enzyme